MTDVSQDTGLYELYKNIVRKFNDSMINEMKRYAGERPDLPVSQQPTNNWYSRSNNITSAETTTNGWGPNGCGGNGTTTLTCEGEHGRGMAYSYGGKQTVQEFNTSVSRWKAPPNSVYPYIISKTSTTFSDYKGNIIENTGLIDAAIVKGVNMWWPGLYASEKGTATHYEAQYWAGIDCMGLVWHGIKAGYDSLSDAGIKLGSICGDTCATKYTLDNSNALKYLQSTLFNIENDMKNNVYYPIETTSHGIHKGDFGTFPNHAFTVYSNKWGQSANPFPGYPSNYDVIQALGFDCKDIHPSVPDDTLRNKCVNNGWWFRKVGITPNNRPWFNAPDKFGRIILWD